MSVDLSKLSINSDSKQDKPANAEPEASKKEEQKQDSVSDAKESKEPEDKEKKEETSESKDSTESKPVEEENNLVQNEYEVEVKLSDQQADPNSPLYSAKSFQELGLTPELLKGIVMMRFNKPSKIQERALPLLLANPARNMIAQSQSGTGKTAAFVLNMLSRVVPSIPTTQALCLCPSRELARQNLEVVRTMSKYMPGLTSDVAVPGSMDSKELQQVQIVVGTPGRITELIRRKTIDISKLQCLVLDEADNMLESGGMGPTSLRIKKVIPQNSQVVLFSATFPDEVTAFAHKFCPEANELRLKHTDLNVDAIKQIYMDCDNDEDKFNVLKHLYGLLTIGSSIIFTARRDSAELLQKKMNQFGHQVSVLHGQLQPEDRDKRIDDFRSGASKVLITTNVLARGIDIPTVSMVVNYDLPVTAEGKPDPSTYLHRIGRTGRFGQIGVAVSFVDSPESFKVLTAIKEYFGEGMVLTKLPTDDWDYVEKFIKKNIRK